jgi:bile acid-coenzyme A ligase
MRSPVPAGHAGGMPAGGAEEREQVGAADRPRTPVGVALDAMAAEEPDAPMVLQGEVVVTRAELMSRTNRLARALAGYGVVEGSFVTIGVPNSIAWYEAVVAAWKLGAIPQPVSHRLPGPEIAAIVALADPPVVVGLDPGDGRPWLPVGWTPPDDVDDGPLPARISPSWKAPTSGGSTGRPKLIVSAEPATVESISSRGDALRIRPGSRFLCTAPLYHNGPSMFSLIALVRGGSVVVMPRFDAAESLRLVERHRITWMYVVPTMMGRILALPAADRAVDLSSLETVFHVGAPCPPHVKRGWIDLVGPERLLELYAGTEGQAATVITGTEWLAHPGSVGRVDPDHFRLLDPEGADVATGEVGEIWMLPPGRPTYRYIGAEARRREGGWESLGDLGSLDAEGYLYLADRMTDMVLVGGANVYPAEVENALSEHPAVLSACVIGLPDEDLGNRLHAIVEVADPATPGTPTPAELAAHLSARLVPYKVPRTFELTAEALRDDAGKMRRSALRSARLVPATP